jgi:AraC-like DNA-binding protein
MAQAGFTTIENPFFVCKSPSVIDPLAEVVALLQPGTSFSKVVSGAGSWRVRRSESGRPFYCVILEGACCLTVDGEPAVKLETGDFVLIPSAHGFTMSGLDEEPDSAGADSSTFALPNGEIRHGIQTGPPDVRLLIGYCRFGSPDAALLISLLPLRVLIRGEPRLGTLVKLVEEESSERRPARDMVLARLLEVLLIEAFRFASGPARMPGLVRGLADERLAVALRLLHGSPAQPWTIAQLANEAALSRSAFFDRFSRALGVAPMEYLLAWRMALAKNLLRRKAGGIADIAERVGYSSASAFSVAFSRHVGVPPTCYAAAEP